MMKRQQALMGQMNGRPEEMPMGGAMPNPSSGSTIWKPPPPAEMSPSAMADPPPAPLPVTPEGRPGKAAPLGGSAPPPLPLGDPSAPSPVDVPPFPPYAPPESPVPPPAPVGKPDRDPGMSFTTAIQQAVAPDAAPGLDLGQMSGTGGVAGTSGQAVPGLTPQAAPGTQNATGTATTNAIRDFSRLTGYDEGKLNANKDDAKYQMGGVLSGFDPRQGITPEVLAGLNGLGYGTFSGQGDKLSLAGLTDKGRAANLQGDYQGADFIQGLKSGNGKWGYADPVEEAKQARGGGAAMTNGGMAPLTDIPGLTNAVGDSSQTVAGATANATDTTPGMSNDPTAAPSAPGFPPGWQDAGNGMAINPATGQRLPVNHPAYQALLASGGGAGTPAAPGAPPAPTPKSLLQQKIMEMMGTNTTDVNTSDPSLLPQVNAGRLAGQRAEERARNMAAERRHAGGFGTTGALDQDIERIAQGRGEAEAANESGLVAKELQDRFGRVQNAMGMQAGIDAQDKDITHQNESQTRQIAMQERLAQLDAAIRQAQLTQQGQLGNRGMDLQDRQYWGGLGQNNQQFNDTLGFNIGSKNADNYYRWLMAGMGG